MYFFLCSGEKTCAPDAGEKGFTLLVPRYLYKDDFSPFLDELRELPHVERRFSRGEYLWRPGDLIEQVHYIIEGVARTSFINEDGRAKVLFYHGAGMVFPGCHESQFAIERSIVTEAMSPMRTLEFARADFLALARRDEQIGATMFENYARYINLLIFESAHQERCEAQVKLCNVLELLARDAERGQGPGDGHSRRIDISQGDLAEILAMNRVSVARLMGKLADAGIVATHRGWVEILDREALLSRCTGEVAV